MTAAVGEGESELLAPTAELALFVGGAVLTLLVIAFVTALVITIVREERAVARAKAAESGDAPADETGGDR
jgi:uncharacterized membrane protein (DUF106 family)